MVFKMKSYVYSYGHKNKYMNQKLYNNVNSKSKYEQR